MRVQVSPFVLKVNLMNIKIETIKNLKKKITIEVLRKNVILEHNKNLNKISKSININGFRKGKIPENVIKSHFGDDIYKDTINKLLSENLKTIITKEKLNIIGEPLVKSISDEKDKNLIFTVEVEILPLIDVNLSKIKATKYISSIKNIDIINEININKKKNGYIKYNNYKSEKLDKITIDISCKMDNKILERYTFNNVDILLDKKDIILKGLKEKLISLKLNNIEKITLLNNNLKTITADITIKKINRKYLSKTNDTLVILGCKTKSVKDINTYIKSKLTHISEQISFKLIKNYILKELINICDFDIPDSLIDKNHKSLEKDYKEQLKLKLILNELKKQFDINISSIDVENKLYQIYKKNITNKIHKDIIIKNISNILYINKIIKIITNKININTKEINFHTLIKIGNDI